MTAVLPIAGAGLREEQSDIDFFTKGGAMLSSCGTYRYMLFREWAPGPHVNFIMLNPSTADAENDDPTLRRCVAYARRWKFGGVDITNLFAYRATDPRELTKASAPVGPHNNVVVRFVAARAPMVVCAWGNQGLQMGRARQVLDLLGDMELHCIGVTSLLKQPLHPLYQPGTAAPQRYHA